MTRLDLVNVICQERLWAKQGGTTQPKERDA